MKSGEFISSSFLLKLVMRCSFLSPETEIYTKTGESRTDGGFLDILVMVLSFLLDARLLPALINMKTCFIARGNGVYILDKIILKPSEVRI